jgi:predicted secreted protein
MIAGCRRVEDPSVQRKTSGLVQTMVMMTFAVALCLGGGEANGQATGAVGASTPASVDPWPSLASQIFHDHPLGDGGAVLAIDTPYRAEDAAVVPLTIQVLLRRATRAESARSRWSSTKTHRPL